MTTRTEISSENQSFYDKNLLDRAVPYFVHTLFGDIRDIPMNSGTDTVKFRKYGNLAAQTTPLVEGVTPTGKKLSVTDVTAQVQYYGDFVPVTDKVIYESLDPVLTEAGLILGDQAGDSVDQIVRDVLAAGTTVQYASTASGRGDITAAMKLTAAEVKEAVRTLKNNLARPITSMVDVSTGYNSVPLKPSFIMIVHPNTGYDIEGTEGFTPVEKYANKSGVLDHEIGAFPYVRVVESTNAKIFSGAGNGGADVYASLILGMHAYSLTRISGLSMKNIIKPLGSGGTSDPLDQRATSGWKLTLVAKITQQAWMIRIEHGVSA